MPPRSWHCFVHSVLYQCVSLSGSDVDRWRRQNLTSDGSWHKVWAALCDWPLPAIVSAAGDADTQQSKVRTTFFRAQLQSPNISVCVWSGDLWDCWKGNENTWSDIVTARSWTVGELLGTSSQSYRTIVNWFRQSCIRAWTLGPGHTMQALHHWTTCHLDLGNYVLMCKVNLQAACQRLCSLLIKNYLFCHYG